MWGTPSLYNKTKLTVGSFGNKFYRANAELFVDKVSSLLCRFFSFCFLVCVAQKYASVIEEKMGLQRGQWKEGVEREMQLSVEEWHRGKDEWFRTLKNTETYRVLVALVINTLSPWSKPWRERMQFRDDWLKPANQVACSEFVVKAALQSAHVLGSGQLIVQLFGCVESFHSRRKRLSAKTGIPEEEIVNPRINPRRRLARYR